MRLSCQGELLGEGWLGGPSLTYTYPTSEAIEVPTTHRMIQYVTDTLSQSPTVSLELGWSGMVRLTLSEDRPVRIASDPAPGQHVERRVHDGTPISMQVARSDWLSKVLSPIRQEDFLYLEVAVPRDTAANAEWRSTLNLLNAAENAYANGDDVSVFTNLRGAIDSLPGAKQHIFDSLPEPKRSKIDELLKRFGEYLHTGRHVAGSDAVESRFPVNHLDAAFAIAACKVLLSYASLTLATASST